MRDFIQRMRLLWRLMLAPPWKPNPLYTTKDHWGTWAASWFYMLLGMFIGASVAPAILTAVELQQSSSYYGWLLIAIAVVIGVVIQIVNYAMIAISFTLSARMQPDMPFWKRLVRGLPALILLGVWFALTFWLTTAYHDLVKSEGSEITLAFLGAVFVKTLVFPAIKAFVTGAAIKWFLIWIREDGNKPTLRS